MPNDQLWASSVLCPCRQVPRPAPKPQTSHMSPSSPRGLGPQPARPPVGPSPANLGVLLQPTKPPPPGRPWDSARSVQCWSEVGAGAGGVSNAGRTHSPCLCPSRPFKASSRPSLPPQLPPLPPRPATGPRQRERCSRSRPREPRVGVNCPREHSAPCPASLLPGCRAAVRPWHWPSCLTNGSTVLSARH